MAPDPSHLDALARDLDAVLAAARDLFQRSTAEQLTWSPDSRTWSIVAIFDHLEVTGSLYYPRLQAAIDRAREKGRTTAAPFRPGWVGRLFIKLMQPDSKRRFKVPKHFKPAGKPDLTALERYLEQQRDLQNLIRQAEGVNLNRTRFGSPVTPLMRFSIGEGLTLMVVHQQRHLRQAERLSGRPDFPAG
jgi:hypothetical protein